MHGEPTGAGAPYATLRTTSQAWSSMTRALPSSYGPRTTADTFTAAGTSSFFALIGLDHAAPEPPQALAELILNCMGAPAPAPKGVSQEKYDTLLGSNRQLCDEVAAEVERTKIAEQGSARKSQELCDLRGELKALGAGEIQGENEALRRQNRLAGKRIEQLEAELDAARREATKAARRGKKAVTA